MPQEHHHGDSMVSLDAGSEATSRNPRGHWDDEWEEGPLHTEGRTPEASGVLMEPSGTLPDSVDGLGFQEGWLCLAPFPYLL